MTSSENNSTVNLKAINRGPYPLCKTELFINQAFKCQREAVERNLNFFYPREKKNVRSINFLFIFKILLNVFFKLFKISLNQSKGRSNPLLAWITYLLQNKMNRSFWKKFKLTGSFEWGHLVPNLLTIIKWRWMLLHEVTLSVIFLSTDDKSIITVLTIKLRWRLLQNKRQLFHATVGRSAFTGLDHVIPCVIVK